MKKEKKDLYWKRVEKYKFPTTLTVNQSEDYSLFKEFEDEQKAWNFMKRNPGTMVYTQVDAEKDDGILYMRGHHLVNRTGFYIVLKK